MEEISHRCREIEERVRALIDKKKVQKEQVNPNLPNLKQPYVKYNYQRPISREKSLSRNKSIELARQESSASKRGEVSKRSIPERPQSRDRLASLERNRSKESERRRNAIPRYGFWSPYYILLSFTHLSYSISLFPQGSRNKSWHKFLRYFLFLDSLDKFFLIVRNRLFFV